MYQGDASDMICNMATSLTVIGVSKITIFQLKEGWFSSKFETAILLSHPLLSYDGTAKEKSINFAHFQVRVTS